MLAWLQHKSWTESDTTFCIRIFHVLKSLYYYLCLQRLTRFLHVCLGGLLLLPDMALHPAGLVLHTFLYTYQSAIPV